MATSAGWASNRVAMLVLGLCALPLTAAISQEFYRGGVQEVVPPSSPPTVKSSICAQPKVRTVSRLHSTLLGVPGKVKVTETEGSGDQNCTQEVDPSDGTKSEPILYDHWKLHIIMACTVTAAVEFVLIIFIILYWRQIRWHLRKISCPCDTCRRGHEVLDTDEPTEDDDSRDELDFGTIEMGTSPAGRAPGDALLLRPTTSDRQHYAASRGSLSVGCEGVDIAVPGPSGLRASAGRSTLIGGSLGAYISDDSLSDVEIPPPVVSSPSKHQPRGGVIKGTKGRGKTDPRGGEEVGRRDSAHSDGSDSPLLHPLAVDQLGRPAPVSDGRYVGAVPSRAHSEANLMMARLPRVTTRRAGSVQQVYRLVYEQQPAETVCDSSSMTGVARNKMDSSSRKPTANNQTCSLSLTDRTALDFCDGRSACNRALVVPPSECRAPSECLVRTTADVHRTVHQDAPTPLPATLLSLPCSSVEHVPSISFT